MRTTSWIRLGGNNCNSMPLETTETRLTNISYPLYPDNMNYASVILRDLSKNLLISLYFAILLQQKVMIVTSRVERVSLLIECIFKLLYPLDTSMYTTIGFISEGMMEFAGAPVPVIFGCHPKVFKAVHEYELSSIKSEVVIINVDEDK